MARVSEESFGIIPLKHSGDMWSVFLILHKYGNHWGFPKGKSDPNESPLESATRELFEETGLKVEKMLINKPITEKYAFYRNKDHVMKTVHYFPAIVTGALLLQPEEIRDGKWMLLDQASSQLTFDEAKRLCSKIQELVSN